VGGGRTKRESPPRSPPREKPTPMGVLGGKNVPYKVSPRRKKLTTFFQEKNPPGPKPCLCKRPNANTQDRDGPGFTASPPGKGKGPKRLDPNAMQSHLVNPGKEPMPPPPSQTNLCWVHVEIPKKEEKPKSQHKRAGQTSGPGDRGPNSQRGVWKKKAAGPLGHRHPKRLV